MAVVWTLSHASARDAVAGDVGADVTVETPRCPGAGTGTSMFASMSMSMQPGTGAGRPGCFG